MFDSQETNRLRDLVNGGAVLDKSTVLDMLTELEARGNKVVNLEKQIQRVRELHKPVRGKAEYRENEKGYITSVEYAYRCEADGHYGFSDTPCPTIKALDGEA